MANANVSCTEEEPGNLSQSTAAVEDEETRLLNLALQQSKLLQQQAVDESIKQAIAENFRENTNNQDEDMDDDQIRIALQMSIDEQDPVLLRAVQMSIHIDDAKEPIQPQERKENDAMNIDDEDDAQSKAQDNIQNMNMNDLYNLLPTNPFAIREEMKSETFINRLQQSEALQNEIKSCENKLRELKTSLQSFEDIHAKQRNMDAWNIFLSRWRSWDINGLHHYLCRIDNGIYKHYIANKQTFIDNWNKVVVDDNGDRFNNNNTFYGHYIMQFESDDLQDFGIALRVGRRHILNSFRSLSNDQPEGSM